MIIHMDTWMIVQGGLVSRQAALDADKQVCTQNFIKTITFNTNKLIHLLSLPNLPQQLHEQLIHLHPWQFLSQMECLHQNYFEIFIWSHVLNRECDGATASCNRWIAYPVFPKLWLEVMIELYIYFKTSLLFLQDRNMALPCYPLRKCIWRKWGRCSFLQPSISFIWN